MVLSSRGGLAQTTRVPFRMIALSAPIACLFSHDPVRSKAFRHPRPASVGNPPRSTLIVFVTSVVIAALAVEEPPPPPWLLSVVVDCTWTFTNTRACGTGAQWHCSPIDRVVNDCVKFFLVVRLHFRGATRASEGRQSL